MIRDRASESDPLDQHLRQKYRIRLITPHKESRDRKSTRDDLELHHSCRRWRIERFFVWLQDFRRMATRRGNYDANFLAMLQVGYLVIFLRYL
jgi:transposase